VILLSDVAKARYSDARADLDGLETFVTKYEDRFEETFTAEGRDALSIDEKTKLLNLSALAGARQLTWASVHAINDGLASALFLATRAHAEMTGLVAYLLLRLREHRTGALSADAFETLLGRLHLGRLHGLQELAPELVAQVQALPVGKLVAAVDTISSLPEPHQNAFKDAWAWLSEFCHPNSLARVLAGQRLEGRTMRFLREPIATSLEISTAVGYACISHDMFFRCFDEVTSLVGRGRRDTQ